MSGPCFIPLALDRTNVRSLKAFFTLCYLKADFLTVLQGLETFSLNFGEVGK